MTALVELCCGTDAAVLVQTLGADAPARVELVDLNREYLREHASRRTTDVQVELGLEDAS